MIFLRIAFLMIVCGTGLVYSQVRAPAIDLQCTGNTHISNSDLIDGLRLQNLLTYRSGIDPMIRNAILQMYFKRGYYFCRIDSLRSRFIADSTSVVYYALIQEGVRILADTAAFEGNSAFSTEFLQQECGLAPGAVFSEGDVQSGISRLLSLYDQNGYPFTSISVGDISLRTEGGEAYAQVRLDIREGEKFFISEFRVEGNTETQSDVIIRETRIAEGEVYNAEKISDIRRRLERLQLFSSVSEPELYIRKGKGGLKLRVVEGSTNIFDGVVGYQPPRGTETSGSITGLVNLSFRNLFGSGRRLDARWERSSPSVSELEIRYLEPWVFSYPFNLQGSFLQRQQDSSYVRRMLEGRATFLATSVFHVSATIQSIQVIPSQGVTGVVAAAGSTLTGGLELFIDTRDNTMNPRSGIVLRNGYSGGKKTYTRIQTAERISEFLQHISLDASYYLELFARNILALSVHGREIRGNELDISDLYRLGGANTLRGYREEQFIGSRIGWLNMEYRYSLGRKSFAFLFFDVAYIDQKGATGQSEAGTLTRNGYGIGGRIETGIGILGVSYALGQGDTFMNGKIHFGLINEF